jgi:hypothetical protein
MQNQNITWTSSANCPSNQLTQLEANRYAIVAPYSTYIKSAKEAYTWEDGELLSELNSLELIGAVQMQQGVRLVNKVIVTYSPSAKKELLKTFNKAGFIEFTETTEGFLFSNNVDTKVLESIEGVYKVEPVAIVQRKQYKPTFISTGIYIDNLPWHILNTPTGKFNPYLLASNKVTFIDGEMHIALYPVSEADYTIVPAGEVIAELMLFTNNKEVSLVREDLIAHAL